MVLPCHLIMNLSLLFGQRNIEMSEMSFLPLLKFYTNSLLGSGCFKMRHSVFYGSDIVLFRDHPIISIFNLLNARSQVIGNATRCALSTSQLVACSKVVAPTIGNPMCQEQLIEASRLVAKSVEAVVQSSQMATDNERALSELGNAATAVTKALNDLLQHIKEKV